mgnify:CR=1 FL=1
MKKRIITFFALMAFIIAPAMSQRSFYDFTVQTIDGEEFSMADLKGKVVVLNFWASWCIPCEEEAEILEAAWRYYQPRGDVLFLGVAWTDTDKKSLHR